MLSSTSRKLTNLTAALFALLGSAPFLGPGWAAAGSPWQISSPAAMTMGSLYLGIAGLTFLTYGWFMRRRSGASMMESRGYE